MKKFITIIITIILAVAMTACEASGAMDTSTGKVQPIEDYHVTTGWNEGEIIATPEGHYWIVENPHNYVGYVEVAYDGRGTETLEDDVIVLIMEVG